MSSEETVEKWINRTLSLPKRPVPRSNSGYSVSSGSEFACFSTVSTGFGTLSELTTHDAQGSHHERTGESG